MKKFRVGFLAMSLAAALSGCAQHGEDIAQGTQGNNKADSSLAASGALKATLIGRATLNAEKPEGAAEIVAYQASKKWIYAVNSSRKPATVEIIDANHLDPAALVANAEGVITSTNLDSIITIDLSRHTQGDANSIAVDDRNALLAVAIASGTPGVNGQVAFYDISGQTPTFIKNVEVGDLPDALTFSPDGSVVVVANEGEPSGDYRVDPEGSISVIRIADGLPAETAVMLDFSAFDSQQAALEAKGVIFSNPTGRTIHGNTVHTTVSMDLEPEYVAISEDSRTAFVTLQENNGLAIVDLKQNTLDIVGLGFKNWKDLQFDASDKDGGIHFQQYPNLYGIYQPDTIAAYQWQGQDFVVSANEGDGREYFFDAENAADCLAKGGLDYDKDDGCLAFIDEARVEDLNLGPAFARVANDDTGIGRLKVHTGMGDADRDGVYESLYTYGARSFTIWDRQGKPVFDSADQVDRITARIHGDAFNNDEDENKGDTRSDAKGAEPEALTIGKIGDRTYAFLGLERMGGVLVYDITNPHDVSFVEYFFNRGLVEGAEISGDLAPEGMKFVSAEHSATGRPFLIVGNEISGSVALWQFEQQ
ncbi:choice-of-anchor I family protein [Photobacterium sp. MCCC 1A19761]|uniref:choice-of-anchor I family protein n=1 Tax=Photobacterium sp. MCCC 1A19761 TaxID=3115000 RepID=UPI00307EB698